MTIHVKPHLEAMLKAQVAAGNFPDVEAALEAAIRTLEADVDDHEIELVRLLDEAEAGVAERGTLSHEEVWAKLEKRHKSK